MSQRNNEQKRSTKMIYFGIVTLMIVLLHSSFAGAALLQERNTEPLSVGPQAPVNQQKNETTSSLVGNIYSATNLDRSGKQWEYLEWSIENPAYSGNPFDLIAEVTFEHQGSSELRRTQMFYAGENTWKFRFTGTEPGVWRFNSQSSAATLNGLSGTVTVTANPQGRGFVTHFDDKWGWSGTGEVFVPQLVMYRMLYYFYDQPELMDADIEEFLHGHGFNGLHVPNIAGAWFNVEKQDRRIEIGMSDPDIRTFEALETLIGKVYAAGGSVHIWAWGDEDRRMTPIGLAGGINGPVDQRLQRYIAARLGPLPGWTMGYGFDLWEWVQGPQLTTWHEYMHRHMGWPHLLGGRASKHQLNQLAEVLDYSGYEQHRPTYATYVETISQRPQKPSFSEDRFRIRNAPEQDYENKDYTMQMTRRGLYHSAMAGGVANIWGNLVNGATSATGSAPYPNPEWIKTYATVFKQRFTRDLQRCPSLSDGLCLQRPDHRDFIFYKEDTTSIRLDLAQMNGSQPAVAIDTKLSYAEINLGNLSGAEQTWSAPYASDWVVVVGTFAQANNPLPGATPTPTPLPTPISTPLPTAEPRCPLSQEALITDIEVSSDRVYELDELAPDLPLYIDRDYRISRIPNYLSGAMLIRTANADKTSDDLNHLQFELSMPATLYVAYDDRATALPAWINAGWEATGDSLTTTDGVLNLYRKQADCGEVVLGGNAVPPMSGADTNYVVIAHAQLDQQQIYLPFLNR